MSGYATLDRVNTCVLHHPRSDGAHRPLDEIHHTVHDTFPRALATDRLATQIAQPDQPTDPLVLEPAQPDTVPLFTLIPRRHPALRVPRQQQRLALGHVLPHAPAPDGLEVVEGGAEGVVGKGSVSLRRGEVLRPRRDAPHPAVAQVHEVGVPRGHDADGGADAAVLEDLVPDLLAPLGVEEDVLELVALARHERRRDGVDDAVEPLLQLRDVRHRDVQAHDVHLDPEEGDRADPQSHELVFLLARISDGSAGRWCHGGEVDGLGEGGDSGCSRWNLLDFIFR